MTINIQVMFMPNVDYFTPSYSSNHLSMVIISVFDRANFPGYPFKNMLTLGRKLALVVVASTEK